MHVASVHIVLAEALSLKNNKCVSPITFCTAAVTLGRSPAPPFDYFAINPAVLNLDGGLHI